MKTMAVTTFDFLSIDIDQLVLNGLNPAIVPTFLALGPLGVQYGPGEFQNLSPFQSIIFIGCQLHFSTPGKSPARSKSH
jgi:hypothetical protein